MENQLSRRQALAGIGVAGATAALPIAGAAIAQAQAHGDTAILAAWEARQAALARIEKRGTFFDAEDHSPADVEIYDAADELIGKATATTPRGLLAQAWVALAYAQDSFSLTNQRQNALIRRADYEALAADKKLDWEPRTILALIRSLRAMIGEA